MDPELVAESLLTEGSLTLLPAGKYKRVRALQVHDGDTLWVLIPVAVKIRLSDIDAPELSTPRGPASRDYLAGMVIDKDFELDLRGDYKYGGERMGVITVNGVNVGGKMVQSGHATPWDGTGTRPGSRGIESGEPI